MTDLLTSEAQRARWRRALCTEGLDIAGKGDFAAGGLAHRLETNSVRFLLLPGDPEGESVPLDEDLWAWIEANETVDIGGRAVRLGDHHTPTAHAAALVNAYQLSGPWRSYIAVRRSGAIDYALGDRGARDGTRDSDSVRIFHLTSIVGHALAFFRFATALTQHFEVQGPYLLAIALRDTNGAHLGNLGEGWAEPLSWENRVEPCQERHVLWTIQLPALPEAEQCRPLAFELGDRLEATWGVRQRRYLDGRGANAGQLDVRRVSE